MKRIFICLIVMFSDFLIWSGETGLFTYEGGFFTKNGNT